MAETSYKRTSRHQTPCEGQPCVHGATCVPEYSTGGYQCACTSGYTGSNCETIEGVNECLSSPCQNGGSCIDGVDSYICACSSGFSGINCETDVDECLSSPCQNGGLCIDGVNSYTCSCRSGFTGINCEEDVDECSISPCQNGGSCTDGVNGYTCSCSSGFTGINCETDVDECSSSPCQNGGSCIDGVNSYTCSCSSGFTGINCEADLDECSSSPCQNGGTCTNGADMFTCTCTRRYSGLLCESMICPIDLGMKAGDLIKNSDISESTFYDGYSGNWYGHFARLDGPYYWCAADSDPNPYLQIRLDKVYSLRQIATQGTSSQFITVYKLETSTSTNPVFSNYTVNGLPYEFTGNTDGSTTVTNDLPVAINALDVRILCIEKTVVVQQE